MLIIATDFIVVCCNNSILQMDYCYRSINVSYIWLRHCLSLVTTIAERGSPETLSDISVNL